MPDRTEMRPEARLTRPEIMVVAAIVWQGGRFLAVRRPEGKPMAGYWEFPGGKVEPGESLEAALRRELLEELALEPTAWAYWREVRHAYEEMDVRLAFFHVSDFAGRPMALEGHDLAWLTAAEALARPFLPADTGIVRDLNSTNS